MHAVKAMGIAEKISRGFRRAADAGQLGDSVRQHVQFETRLNNRRADRIVPATRTQCGNRAFVIAPREADFIDR